MIDLGALLTDLDAESMELDSVVAALPHPEWARATPAPGWTVAHQIAHLAWTDGLALLAVLDEARFRAETAARPDGAVDDAADEGAQLPPTALLATWRTGRAALADALASLPAGARLAWIGPPMSAASMATARLMETWAHGQDVADALGVAPVPTGRLRHIAHLGVRTRDFAFEINHRKPPEEPFRIELIPPPKAGGPPVPGEQWTWGPADAIQRVSGPALDFCLRVTQRRHRADLALRAVGDDADTWLDIAQAFAGPPDSGRPPGATP